jgi:hypothetical protein
MREGKGKARSKGVSCVLFDLSLSSHRGLDVG